MDTVDMNNSRSLRTDILPNGTVLNSKYIIESVIGQGGFGITYKAWNSLLNTWVAIKEYYPSNLATRIPGYTSVYLHTETNQYAYQHGLSRFLNEARDLAKFNNQANIVSVYDFFEENNTAYMVMEFLEGMNLKEYLKSMGGILNEETVVYVCNSVLDALETIHHAKIIHRDISPDNIFFCTDMSIKLIDFGAAKMSLFDSQETVSIILKPGYAPPEQYIGKEYPREYTDIYALGATLYHIATGVPPVESVSRMINDSLKEPRAINNNIPLYLNNLIMKAMRIHPSERYQNAAEMKKDLTKTRQLDVMDTEPDKAGFIYTHRKLLITLSASIAAVLIATLIIYNGFLSKSKNTSDSDTYTSELSDETYQSSDSDDYVTEAASTDTEEATDTEETKTNTSDYNHTYDYGYSYETIDTEYADATDYDYEEDVEEETNGSLEYDDVYEYYETDAHVFASYFDNLEYYEDTEYRYFIYSNDYMDIWADLDTGLIYSIYLYGESDLNMCGVYVGMNTDDIYDSMTSYGYSDISIEYCENDGDTYTSILFNDHNSISRCIVAGYENNIITDICNVY